MQVFGRRERMEKDNENSLLRTYDEMGRALFRVLGLVNRVFTNLVQLMSVFCVSAKLVIAGDDLGETSRTGAFLSRF
jgi:hypothetical protein